jgi:HEAT repeat protein
MQTVAAIGILKSDAAAAVLEAELDRSDDGAFRVGIAYALGACGTPRASRRLKALVRDRSAEERVRAGALDALVRNRPDRVFDLVRETARDWNTPPGLRVKAYESLARYPLERTESLWRKAVTGAPPAIRALAFRALAPLQDRQILYLAGRSIRANLEHPEVRAAAVLPWKAAGGPKAVRLLLGASRDACPLLHAAIADALASLTREAEAAVLIERLESHRDPAIRALIAGALGGARHPEALRALDDALSDEAAVVRLAALDALGRRPETEAERILKRKARNPDLETAVAAVDALAVRTTPAPIAWFSDLLADTRQGIRVAAVDAIGLRPLAEGMPLLDRALDDPAWPVRAAAIRALGRHRARESIGRLIVQLGREDGRLRADIAGALQDVTDRHLGFEAGPWRDWWTARRRGEVGRGGDVDTVAYHDIPVLSRRILFCLDISSSMAASGDGGETRLARAKKELARVLSALPPDACVNLLFFDDRITAWRDELTPIGPSRTSALQAVSRIRPRGSTDIGAVLERSFEDASVDTIYLLSDGKPNAGSRTVPETILREVRRVNRTRQVTIHAIALGCNPFLATLAEANGGRYVERR